MKDYIITLLALALCVACFVWASEWWPYGLFGSLLGGFVAGNRMAAILLNRNR